MQSTTIGFDVAKNIYQVHGVGSAGGSIVRRKVRRAEVLPFFKGYGAVSGWLGGMRECPSLGPRDRETRAGLCHRSMSALM
jgi:transposase